MGNAQPGKVFRASQSAIRSCILAALLELLVNPEGAITAKPGGKARHLVLACTVSRLACVCRRNECSALAGMIVTQYGQISRENSLAPDGRGGLCRQSVSAMEHLRAHYGLTPHGSPTSGLFTCITLLVSIKSGSL